ncbi:MAG TPA: ribosome-associated translation inhibitor RaiA [Anaerohalosphaeraceae bacterium]|nr:ribosome-associated translation inhibitor RaiA [Anaerohalosphaeraceae bacterium]HOL87931.1 ribosome-associated translation inhibitor RaiA [Anaerohalosphaeraceae bacterium]HPP55430.1 ribosome-associated translation inhibitor RaiA [Anaerohalosphaeraceae bacterium]
MDKGMSMLFTITGRHIEITDAIREHAKKRADKLPRFHSNIARVEVLVEEGEGPNYTVEVIAHVEHEALIAAKEMRPELYTALDAAFDKMVRQLKKKKEKQRDNKRSGISEPEPFGKPEREDVA